MLKFLNFTAQYLHRFKAGLWLLLFGSIAGFFTIIFTSEASADAYAMLCAVLCLWSLVLLMIASYFPTELADITEDDSFFTRLKKRLYYAFSWLIALISVLASIAIVITTIRMFMIITR